MKLTKHQKKIVDKIIDGKICDIPSYLKEFNLGCEQQYAPELLRTTFEEAENGKTYIFREEDHNFYTYIYDASGNECHKQVIDNQMTYPLKDSPMTIPVSAQLDLTIRPETVSFKGKTFQFNFLKNKYYVANSFLAIKDFLALWSYLRREALVFEGRKPISDDDLSVFFEEVRQDIQPETYPQWHQKNVLNSSSPSSALPKFTTCMIPRKSANSYIKSAWKINQNHLAMCEDYVGLKLMSTSELQVYRQKGYRTVEERSQWKNLFVAWIAVAISVIAVILGNIIPLFQKSDTDYLNQISQQISVIEKQIQNDTAEQNLATELDEIQDKLTLIIEAANHIPSEETTLALEELAAKIEELNRIIEEHLIDAQ